MTKTSPFVVTISRQLGSGGAYLGQRLSMRLNALYLDHEDCSSGCARIENARGLPSGS